MEEFIARLLDLQELDKRIDRLKADLESIPGELRIHLKERKAHQSRYEEQKSSFEGILEGQKQLAAERAACTSRIADYRSRLLSLKSNEEYSAMLKQIAHAERTIDEIDSRIIEEMYHEDEAREEIDRARRELERALRRSTAREENLSSRLEETRGLLQGLEEKRREAAARVDAKYLRRYEKARETGHREAVVGIRGGSCGGCLTKIPAQSAGEIRAGVTFSCPICGSFVVWTEDSSL